MNSKAELSDNNIEEIENECDLFMGKSKSIERIKDAAKKHLKNYLLQRKFIIKVDEFDDLSFQCKGESFFCNKSFFCQFGNWLSKDCKKLKQSTSLIKIQSALEYLGAVKEMIRHTWPYNVIWNDHDGGAGLKLQGSTAEKYWFTKLRYDILRDDSIQAMSTGRIIQDSMSLQSTSRVIMSEIIEYYLSKNTVIDLENAAILCVTYHCMGRSGEFKYLHYQTSGFDIEDKIFYMFWNSVKTITRNKMTFYPDYELYQLDFYFIFACYLISGGGSEYTANSSYDKIMKSLKLDKKTHKLIFPSSISTSSESRVNDLMKQCVGKIPSMPCHYNVSGKSIRRGAAIEIIVHKDGNRDIAAHRGGWGIPKDDASEYYIQFNYIFMMKSGKILSGYPDAETSIVLPKDSVFMDTLSENEKKRVKLLVEELFRSFHISIMNIKELEPLGWLLFASLLRHMSKFQSTQSVNHLVMKKLILTANRFSFSKEQLEKLGPLNIRRL